MKKKLATDIKAVFMLIIAENIIALRNVIGTLIESISKSVHKSGGKILPLNKKKT